MHACGVGRHIYMRPFRACRDVAESAHGTRDETRMDASVQICRSYVVDISGRSCYLYMFVGREGEEGGGLGFVCLITKTNSMLQPTKELVARMPNVNI